MTRLMILRAHVVDTVVLSRPLFNEGLVAQPLGVLPPLQHSLSVREPPPRGYAPSQ